MLTKNDKKKIIYSKLIELEGEELEDWVNKKFKGYVSGYGYKEDEKIINRLQIYEFMSINYDKLFTNCREFLEIQSKMEGYDMDKFGFEFNCILNSYCYMYIDKMEATDLKEYIINLIDPVEPK
jgi:succinate dehydrogenase flavin-adding protein (antitoxin of CptAB toxin-antitoxin module)